MNHRSVPTRISLRAAALLAFALALVLSALPASGAGQGGLDGPAWDEYGFQGEGDARIEDFDARVGKVAPTATQKAIAADLGATSARWNAFGTPHVLINHDGYLSGRASGDAAEVARGFVRDNAALFRLDAARVDSLKVVRDAPLYDAPDLKRAYGGGNQSVRNPDVAHVVSFSQTFGGLDAAVDGLLTIGVQNDGRIAWVTSNITGDATVSGGQRVSAADAVQAAAADVGMNLGTLSEGPTDATKYTTFTGDAVKDVQRARLMALPTPTQGVRRVWEVALLDTEIDEHGNPTAFLTYVDAENAKIWNRTNKLEHFAEGVPGGALAVPTATGVLAQTGGGGFEGETAPGGCGPLHEFEVPEGVGQITVTVQSPENPNLDTGNADLTIDIIYNGEIVAHGDTLGNPEAATYAPPADTLPGTYAAKVCNFNPDDPAFQYTGNFILTPVGTSETGEDGSTVPLPTWRVFPSNPPFVAGFDPADHDSDDTRKLWCWNSSRFPAACDEEQRNTAARTPWDVNGTSTPSFTTDGNFASTAVSEISPFTPDTPVNRPVSPSREYDYPWGNKWFENSCDPTRFGAADPVTGGPNDEAAATANLFVMHNRMHDWSYFLGFTEVNSNLQKTNFGNTGPERENDPELGSSQAGRRTVNGRDNANQITLGDGIAPITNQYLWQPLAGAFYAPCVDGAYDMAVVAHEYGHAISNRMIGKNGGPLSGTGRTQGQTESWSDLIFAGYFTEFAISAGEGVNPYVLGPYVTGDPKAGIRNYAMNHSPLNYSDLNYDPAGLGSPHANGEIWSATNFDILTDLNNKYDARFPSTNKRLQRRCARGVLPADFCPGNRRWNQIQFDSFLIQPSGSTMVDSRDAMLAADRLRFGGANQKVLWNAFAKRGLGENAKAEDANDVNSRPSFVSPKQANEARVRFTAPAGVKDMQVHVGRFEANVVPIADTVGDTKRDHIAKFVPGRYRFIATAPGFGAKRFTLNLAADERLAFEVPMRFNHASIAHGAKATGDGVNLDNLIDDSEATNWASLESSGTASEGKGEGQQVEGRQVTVNLAGKKPVNVTQVQISAALRPPVRDDADEDEELPTDPDAGNQSRFAALRSFNILACNASQDDCSKADSFRRIFKSADDAFPATRPRPRIPDLIVRPFDVKDTNATHIKLVVRDNQCTGGPDFQGENNPDDDPNFNPDCDTTAPSPDRAILRSLAAVRQQVRAAELQVFGGAAVAVAPVGDGTTTPPRNNDDTSTPPRNNDNDDGGSNDDGGGNDDGAGNDDGGGNDAAGSDNTAPAPAARTLAATPVQPRSDTLGGVLAATGMGTPTAAAIGLLLLVAGSAMVLLRRKPRRTGA